MAITGQLSRFVSYKCVASFDPPNRLRRSTWPNDYNTINPINISILCDHVCHSRKRNHPNRNGEKGNFRSLLRGYTKSKNFSLSACPTAESKQNSSWTTLHPTRFCTFEINYETQKFVARLNTMRPLYHLGLQAFQAAIFFCVIIPDRLWFTPGNKEQLKLNTNVEQCPYPHTWVKGRSLLQQCTFKQKKSQ
jgi:hypothetical protein